MAYNTNAYVKVGTSLQRVNLSTHWNMVDGKPSNYPPTVHNHDASNITSGTLSIDRIPNITAGKIDSAYETRLLFAYGEHKQGVNPLDIAINNEFSSNRLALLPAEYIHIEYSRDGGVTWDEYPTTDEGKINLVTKQAHYYIGGTTSGITTDYKLRITITAAEGVFYTSCKKIHLNISTNGASGSNVIMQGRTVGNFNTATDNWTTFINGTPITGWSGWNVLNYGVTFGGEYWQTSNYRQLRFTFGITGLDATYSSTLEVLGIRMYGENAWGVPNNMARTGHLYDFDYLQNAKFPADVYSNNVKLVKDNDSRLSDSRPASDVSSWAKAETKPTYNQDEISDGSTYKRVTQTEKNLWNAKWTAPATTAADAGKVVRVDPVSYALSLGNPAIAGFTKCFTIAGDNMSASEYTEYGNVNGYKDIIIVYNNRSDGFATMNSQWVYANTTVAVSGNFPSHANSMFEISQAWWFFYWDPTGQTGKYLSVWGR